MSPTRGFSLLEVMIALALGLLLSVGIISLFSSTSSTNKLQDGLAHLQENGRFAVTRMEQDLRRVSGQYCSNTAGGNQGGSTYPLLPARVPMVYARTLVLPDMHDKNIEGFGANGQPLTSPATAAYALSSRWFIQGYRHNTVPGTSDLPDAGLAVGKRVPGSDVLTVRYLRGTGWPMAVGACALGDEDAITSGTTITVSPQPGDDPLPAAADIEAALLSDCISPSILPISNISGNTLTVGTTLTGAVGALCNGNQLRDMRLFNFTEDFVTVSYYLVFRADPNTNARPNTASAGRLIPTLVRRENGEEQELVRGVDELAFLYGVLDSTGATRFMTADQVQSGTNCTPPPEGVGGNEPNCQWRSVRTIEAHLLVNTVDEVFGLDPSSRTFRFNGNNYTRNDTDTLNSGLLAGSQLRREFIAYISGRNQNF